MNQPPKLHEVKKVYEKNKRNNNVHQIKQLINLNLLKQSKNPHEIEEIEAKLEVGPIHMQGICYLPQKELKKLDEDVERRRIREPKTYANKFITLTGASQSMTSFQIQRQKMEKSEKQQQLQMKRMTIIQQCPSLADFYENYLTKKAKKSKQEIEFEEFINKYEKRFNGFNQYLYMPERKVVHKNKRFIRLDDVDMGDEVEAAIYNDGRKPPQHLRKYVEQQMNKLLLKKMNENNIKVKNEEFENYAQEKLDLDTLIEKNKLLLDSGLVKSLDEMIQNAESEYFSPSLYRTKYKEYFKSFPKSMSQSELRIAQQFQSISKNYDKGSIISEGSIEKNMNSKQSLNDQFTPNLCKVMDILQPRSHHNFINMIAKNQSMRQTQQGPRPTTQQQPVAFNFPNTTSFATTQKLNIQHNQRASIQTAKMKLRTKSQSHFPNLKNTHLQTL